MPRPIPVHLFIRTASDHSTTAPTTRSLFFILSLMKIPSIILCHRPEYSQVGYVLCDLLRLLVCRSHQRVRYSIHVQATSDNDLNVSKDVNVQKP